MTVSRFSVSTWQHATLPEDTVPRKNSTTGRTTRESSSHALEKCLNTFKDLTATQTKFWASVPELFLKARGDSGDKHCASEMEANPHLLAILLP